MTETQPESEFHPMMVYDYPPQREEYPSDLEKDPQESLLIQEDGNPQKEKIFTENEIKIQNAEVSLKMICLGLKFLCFLSLAVFIIVIGSEYEWYLSMPSCGEYLAKHSDREMLFYRICGALSILMIPFQIAFVHFFLQAVQEKSLRKSVWARWMALIFGALSLMNEIFVIGDDYPRHMMQYCGGILYSPFLDRLVIIQTAVGFFFIPMILPTLVLKRSLTLVQNSELKN